jgi:uncharacterized protein (UPF0212 family)
MKDPIASTPDRNNETPAAVPLQYNAATRKKDADYVFYELTRSICPQCKKVIDAQVLLEDNKVWMRKRCPDCAETFEALVYGASKASTTSPAPSRSNSAPKCARAAPTIAVSVPTTSNTPVWASSKSTALATWIAPCVLPKLGRAST